MVNIGRIVVMLMNNRETKGQLDKTYVQNNMTRQGKGNFEM